jgi:membrane protease YdiL (CAAX protease family)
MRKLFLAIVLLLAIAALADWIVVARVPVKPLEFGTLLAATALVLGAFVALTDQDAIDGLRQWAGKSPVIALGIPLLILVPYLIYALGSGTFAVVPALKLAAYALVPTALLLPDRLRNRPSANLRDWLAMAAVAVPIPARWLADVWVWPYGPPQDLYFLLPLGSVCLGLYAFVGVRGLEDVGYKLLWRGGDVLIGVSNWAMFSVVGIPLGYALHFIHFHAHRVSVGTLAGDFLGIYLTVAIPEEVFFRGILQNLLEKSIRRGPPGLYALLIASATFGASHFHHPPVPNWRYCIMATVAGIFYGLAWRWRRRTSASGLTHALVDTLWHFWF